MAFEEIERLKEKINKDPNSKLFVPLAEEYKKAGMFDEAINVLIKGLERQPNYLSARVSLGKIYTERGMLNEAKNEFEKVVSSIPDNLYAHKKLAEIYRSLGEKDKAIKEFKAVLRLNPMDEWAVTNLAEMEKEEFTSKKQSIDIKEEIKEEISEKDEVKEIIEVIQEEVSEEKIEELSEASIIEEEAEELPEIASEESIEVEEEEEIPDVLSAEEEIEMIEGQDESIDIQDETTEAVFDIPVTEEDLKPTETNEKKEFYETLASGPVDIEEISEEELSFEGLEEEAEILTEEGISVPNLSDADQHILKGNYSEAMNIYRRLLSSDPQNKKILQRIEELKFLLRLLGKDKEELIIQLEKLLEGIKKRRDEFFGSP